MSSGSPRLWVSFDAFQVCVSFAFPVAFAFPFPFVFAFFFVFGRAVVVGVVGWGDSMSGRSMSSRSMSGTSMSETPGVSVGSAVEEVARPAINASTASNERASQM